MEQRANRHFLKVRVVSRDFIRDMYTDFQNFFGMNLSPFQRMIEKGKNELWEELEKEGIEPEWYRCDITFMARGSIAIVLYGDAK